MYTILFVLMIFQTLNGQTVNEISDIFNDEKACWKSGRKCLDESTCYRLCCDTAHWYNKDHYECGSGCIVDGTACIPGLSCPYCCSGAYDNNGYTCGGKCFIDGTKCNEGEDCQLCCNGHTYWYTKKHLTCGYDSCLKNGTKCIPNESCLSCCNQAIANKGLECGGTCIKDGTTCDLFSTCNKCCNYYHWDKISKGLKCGLKPCTVDGTRCTPDCDNCCNGAYKNNGTICGGTCLASGTKCEYYSSCKVCCQYSEYSFEKASHICN